MQVSIANKHNDKVGWVSGLCSGLTWGLDVVLLRYVLHLVPFNSDPVLAIAGFFVCCLIHEALGGLMLSAVLGVRGRLRNIFKLLCTRDGLIIAVGALCGGPFAISCYVFALSNGGVALTAGVTAIYPFIGTLLAVILLKERLNPRNWLGLMVAMVGIFYIGFNPDTFSDRSSIAGILFAAGGAIGWGVEAVFCSYGTKSGKIDYRTATLMRETISAIAYIIIIACIIGDLSDLGVTVTGIFSDTTAWILLVATAVIGMFSFYLWYKSIFMIGAARSVCLNITYSFWAVLFGTFILHDHMSSYDYIGSLLVIAGVFVATVFKVPKISPLKK